MRVWTVVALAAMLAAAGCKQEPQEQRAQEPHVRNGHPRTASGPHQPHYEGLIEEYQQVLDGDPHNLAAIIALGNAYYDSRQWREASLLYERALAIEPHDPDIRSDLGTCYRNLGLADRAIAEFRLALRHSPGHLNARYNLGVVYASDKKDYRSAVREWEELLHMAPNYPHAQMIRQAITRMKSGGHL